MQLLKKCLPLAICLLATAASAQEDAWPTPEIKTAYEAARKSLSSGALSQAIVQYQQAITAFPANASDNEGKMILYRDLGQAYYYNANYDKADATLASVITSGKADAICYQVAADSKIAQKENKAARSIVEDGLKHFPQSGLLYGESAKLHSILGEDENALKQWIAGINADPAYRLNYYEAARAYMHTNQPVWAILYGEIFVNQERLTPRSNEIRKMLVAAYKRIYSIAAAGTTQDFANANNAPAVNFADAVQKTLLKLAPVVSDGITVDNLIMLRTRFLIDWTTNYGERYSFSLFNYLDDLQRNGQFEAYNQWLFGRAENSQQYEAWTKFHPEAIPSFTTWQQKHPLRISPDYYNEAEVKGIFVN